MTLPFKSSSGASSSAFRNGPRPLGLYYSILMQQQLLAQGPWQNFVLPDWKTLDMDGFLAGVEAYRNHPFSRAQPELDYTTVWQHERVKLQACGAVNTDSPHVLLVPSLINKSYIFDLLPDYSLVNYLLAQGLNVFVLDWGEPSEISGEIMLSVEACITDYILPALRHLKQAHVVGYCMGGTLSLLAAQSNAEAFLSLSLIATPWDFSVMPLHPQLQNMPFQIEPWLELNPLIAVDMVQSLLFWLDPVAPIGRLISHTKPMPDAERNRLCALEDWLADGVALEKDIAKTLLIDWHKDNILVKDKLNIDLPTLVVTAERDKIVPPASSTFVATQLKQAQLHTAPTGHIGLMAGANAEANCYAVIGNFIATCGA